MGYPLGSTEHLDQQVVTEFGHMFDGWASTMGLATKIKFVGIKYWQPLGRILFFSWQKFLLLSMKYFVGKHLQW